MKRLAAMNRLALGIAMLLVMTRTSATLAQAPKEKAEIPSPGQVQMTEKMWFYEQERRRWDNPKAVVRHKAEVIAAQRRSRIATRQWFGYSNTRPVANSTPVTGSYSPAWGGNTTNSYEWRGNGGSFFGLW